MIVLNLTVDEALKKAIAAQKMNQLQEAAHIYLAILRMQPQHPDANHNLGVLALSNGRHQEGLSYLEAALAANPRNGQFWVSYISGLIALDRLADAKKKLDEGKSKGLVGEAVVELEKKISQRSLQKIQNNKTQKIIKKHIGKKIFNNAKVIKCKNTNKRQFVTHAPSQQAINQLIASYNIGNYPLAENQARIMTESCPNHAYGWKALGAVLQKLGKMEESLQPMLQSIKLAPKDPEAHSNLGNTLKGLARVSEAESSYREAIRLKPDYAEAHTNLGNLLKEQARLEEAEMSCREAIKLKPDVAEFHNNLATILQELEKLSEAEKTFREAIRLKPDFALAYSNLGNVLKQQGNLNEAQLYYRKAILARPDFPEALNNLGNVLAALGCFSQAVPLYREAIRLNQDFPEPYNNLGNAFIELELFNEAEASCRRAIHLNSDYANAHNNLGVSLRALGRLHDAETSYREAIRLQPNFSEAYSNLGNLLKTLGRLREAEECFREAIRLSPNFFQAYFNLLFLYGHTGLATPKEFLNVTSSLEVSFTSTQQKTIIDSRKFLRSKPTGRRLRIGYVSGDFYSHAISYFVEPLFRNHNRKNVSIYAYYNNHKIDNTTKRIQGMVEHWIPIDQLNDDQVLERIEGDQIDVLIDLSGYTAKNRLSVFARRAAPVQAHYLGFFATTGLTAMDYWIGDKVLIPDAIKRQFRERVWHLPRVWVSYDGKAHAPAPIARSKSDDVVWLGSFNNIIKITPQTIAIWAKVLHALPEARLLLKTKDLRETLVRKKLLLDFLENGIDSDRIELQDGRDTDWISHMALYDQLDIVLDPIGGTGGGTTSCDALWMGSIVVTLEGDRMASRMTSSMLRAIGKHEWIAQSEIEYINTVVRLARDKELSSSSRLARREMMEKSPLCDAVGLAKDLEVAYLSMFENWFSKQSHCLTAQKNDVSN